MKKKMKMAGVGKDRKPVEVAGGEEDTPEVNQFELLAGEFTDRSGDEPVSYEKGDVIESPLPLDKLFANKFKPVGGKARRPNDRDDFLDQSGRVMDRPLGTESDDEDEEEDDFTLAQERRKAKRPAKVQTSPSDSHYADEEESEVVDADKEDGEEDGEEAKSEFGKEYTADYDLATKSDLKVFFKKGSGFTVVDADEPSKPLPGGGHLKSKKDVTKFLEKYRQK